MGTSKKAKKNTGRKTVPHTQETPPRVAPRLKGEVKNAGIKEKKK